MAIGSGGGGSGGMGSWLPLLIGAGASAASGVAGAITANKNRKTEAQLAREQMAQQAALAKQALAHDESMADPFRHQMSQATDIGKLDLMERGAYKPTVLTPPARYASSMPQMSGGFSYEKSPELIASAAALKRNVMGGNTAPTMTDPANYGKTGALDLVRMAANGTDPATMNAGARSVPLGSGPVDYMADAQRRGGGTGGVGRGAVGGAMTGASVASIVPGVGNLVGGAIGAGVGAIKGALTKHAATAPTDVDVPTATAILTRVIQQEHGRAPQPGEVEQMLAAQGLKPGDRWVGEQGLRSLIASLTMQPSYTAVA